MTVVDKNNVTYFAETNFRNERKRFGIKRRDRTKHTYMIGKTGMGKTTLLENMAAQDIFNGEGIGIVDPHGDFGEKMLNFVPESRIDDVIYFAPHDIDWPIGFNVMENVDPTQRHLVATNLIGVFKKIWPDVWSARMEYILNNSILALLEYPDSTILGINRMLSDKEYRKEVVDNISDPVVKAFWVDEFAKYSDRFMTEAGAAIQNKIGQFISNPLVRNIVGQTRTSFDIREVMDGKKILIMNLSKGRVGEENSRLLGAMLITKIYLSAMSRVDATEEDRPDFYLYVDEFQNFATESFKDILSEARKYRLNLTLAHQYIAQMDETVRDAVFGNVGTLMAFRVGAIDADYLEKEFAPDFIAQDIVNLGFANIYLRLMVDGVASRPFSATTLPPIKPTEESHAKKIIEMSREKYATAKKEVDEEIRKWHGPSVGRESVGVDGKPSMSNSLPHAGDSKPQMFEASCSVCGKSTYVPFEPDGKRPIFCKTHREKRGEVNTEKKEEPNVSADVVVDKEPARNASAVRSIDDAGGEKPKIEVVTEETQETQVPDSHVSTTDEVTEKQVTSVEEIVEKLAVGQPTQEEVSVSAEVTADEKKPSKTETVEEKPKREERPVGTISLKDLTPLDKRRGENIEPRKKKEPKLDELKQILEEVMAEKKSKEVEKKEAPMVEEKNEKSGVLKPGERITFE